MKLVQRLPVIQKRTGMSRAWIYAAMAARTFPAPIKLGARAVGWLEEDIDAWLALRIKLRDDAEPKRERP